MPEAGLPIPNFYYRPEMLQYDFGPQHPLRPERLRRTLLLLEAVAALRCAAPEPASEPDLLRVHSREYVEAVKRAGDLARTDRVRLLEHGIGPGDNPPFEGMHEKSLWYAGGAVAAASAVRDGERLAFNIAGGLHHAQRDRASGFCVYNDAAMMVAILRERFDRVAYVDIDVHHGDGVQWIFYDDPGVLTVSVHESGRTLFPGTGFTSETGGRGEAHCVNIPLDAGTTGDVWLWAFQTVIAGAFRKFKPQAVVLQMGTDAHFEDPLGHLKVTAQEWLEAVRTVAGFGLPVAACGGGGYNLGTVPRMWAAACMALAGLDVPKAVPASVEERLGFQTFGDPLVPAPRGAGLISGQCVVSDLEARFDLVLER